MDVEYSLVSKDGIDRDPNGRPFVISPDRNFRFARSVNNPENKEVTEIIYVSVNKNSISVSEPIPKNNSLQRAGAETIRIARAIPVQAG